MTEYIYPIFSGRSSRHTSSCSFRYDLPEPFAKDVKEIRLIGGDIPLTTERYLFYDIEEISTKRVSLGTNKRVCGILRWEIPNSTLTLPQISLVDLNEDCNTMFVNESMIQTLTMRIYNKDGEIHSFGNDFLDIESITPGNPPIIKTVGNHGLLVNDQIYINGIDNMSTDGRNKDMNDRWIVSNVLTAQTFNIATDLSTELASQTYTQYGSPYQFALNAKVKLVTDHEYPISGLIPLGNETRVAFYEPHGLSVGTEIRIIDMDNGLLISDNNRLNTAHIISGVLSPYLITIPVQLSAYPPTAYKTGTPSVFLLGEHGSLKISKLQVSFDFLMLCSGRKAYRRDRHFDRIAPNGLHNAIKFDTQPY